MIRILLFSVLTIITSLCFSQKISLIHSGEVIANAKSLYDSGKYADAITEFLKIPERDTNYVYMLSEITFAYIGDKQYDKALEICEQALKDPSPYRVTFLRAQAVATDKKGELEKAVALFKKAIAQYPTDCDILYSLGATYYNNKTYKEAAETFFKVLRINPYHTSSHLNLGRLSIGQGKKTHAMLALGMYLTITNLDNNRLVLLNKFLDNQITDEGSIEVFGANAAEKLDQIIKAKVALDKKFKTKVPIAAPVSRQFEMFFEQLSTISNDTDDSWVSYYLPLYKSIKDENVEPFIYHILSSSDIAVVKKWNSKNEKSLTTFYQLINKSLRKKRETIEINEFGFSGNVKAWYDEDNLLDALGEESADDVKLGHWAYFHDNSQLAAEGNYDDQGKKKGVWKYYNNEGALVNTTDTDTGEVTLFTNGIVAEHFYAKDGITNGEVELFYTCGPLREKLGYKEDKRSGPGVRYFPTGKKQITYQYDNDNATGEFVNYYENGQVSSKVNYKDGKLSGKYNSYYSNGRMQAEGEYLNDEGVGIWKYYYSNGKLQRMGSYTVNVPKEWTYYNSQGELTERRPFNVEDRLHGENIIYYNGKPQFVYTFKKDLLTKIVCYDSAGRVLSSSGHESGNFSVKRYYITGELEAEGAYKKGKKSGVWNYYARSGKLSSEFTYENGSIQGPATEYHPNGAKKIISHYKDDALHGYFQEFYANGKVKQEGWFQNGKREQQWLTYYVDGTLESDYYYILDEFHGKCLDFGVDEKLVSSIIYRDKNIEDVAHYNAKGDNTTFRKEANNIVSFESKYANGKTKAKYDLLCSLMELCSLAMLT
jgi:antitoxin component YwqK of YwqJK toxin-antitoxin module/Tfp pilus assembly protein PilF